MGFRVKIRDSRNIIDKGLMTEIKDKKKDSRGSIYFKLQFNAEREN